MSPNGGIGRRAGLRIQCFLKRTGSNPVSGIVIKLLEGSFFR